MRDIVDQSVFDGDALAPVIQLARVRKDAGGPERAGREAEQARRFLERRYGKQWIELPPDLGRRALLAEQLLTRGPTRLDSDAIHPGDATTIGRAVSRAASTVVVLLNEEREVLGEAVGADLAGLTLRDLATLAEAVVAMGSAPTADPAWAEPSAAEAAEVVLRVHGARLLESAEVHERVYRWFTERVWDVPERILRAGRRPWRVVTRARLRAALTDVSRGERLRLALRPAADLVLRARGVRAELAVAAPLLSRHLGSHDRGALTDVKRAAAALGALRDLQDALGSRLDAARLADLVRADAFRSRDITAPASTLIAALAAWSADLSQLGARNDPEMTASDLTAWAEAAASSLPALTDGLIAVEAMGVRPFTLRELVNDLLARERVEELTGAGGELPAAAGGDTAGPVISDPATS